MSVPPLFVYGTLRDPDLLAALLGRVLPPAHRIAARAPGFRAVHYPHRVYPALVAVPGAVAPGLVLAGLTPSDRQILDAFEGDEYHPAMIAVSTPGGLLDATAYLPTIAIPLDAAPWTLANWTRAHKPCVLGGEMEAAAALRRQLGAKPD